MSKKASNLIEQIADPDNLRLAFWKARKGKTYSKGVIDYRKNLGKNLVTLRDEILRGAVKVGQYTYFKVYDPKERQICASAFREQVLHHALMNICHDTFERWQISDSYASRKGKGTYAAIDKAKKHAKRYAWYLKLDVKKFFESIEHTVLKKQLAAIIKDSSVLLIFEAIIDSYEAHPKRGVPIGNLTSQYFANHYLCVLDHFIKEKLQIKAYIRYMDDMVLWHDDKEVLQKAFQEIKNYVQTELCMELKPKQLNWSSMGLPFLGYKIFPQSVKLTRRSKQRFVKKIRYLDEKYQTCEWDEKICQRRVLPLLAFVKHADTKGFRSKILGISRI